MSVKTAAALEALERQACDLLVTESNMPGARDSRGATLMRTAVVSSGGLVALLVGLTLPAAGRTVAPSPVTALRHELVVIDAGVDLPLEDLARDEAAGRRRSTLVLREEDDGIRAVERHLASHGAVDAVHIVTHGASGLVELGRTRLTPASLAGHAEGLAAWRRFLRPGADVAIYGCDVARDDSGRRFVRDLARLLGADVAASVDRTGSARAGGDWRLEFGVGDVEARVPFTRSALRTWSGLLPIVSFQQGTSGYTGTQDAYLDEQFPGTAFGGAAIVSVENNPGQRQHGLIRFDSIFGAGAGQIPLGSVINSASLTVNVTNTSAAGAQIRLHRMLVTWSEGSTWTSMTGGIQTNDVEARLAFDAQVASPASLGSQVITGLGATLQAWSSGATVHGWAFISNSTDGWDFRSSEDGTVSTRPLLTVDYTAPTGGISGTVFEDVQYGGGAGRSLVASSGVGRSGARVELFDSGGNFLAFAPSGVGGVYAFAALAAGSYTVRVVNSTVTSSRPGAVGGLLPVQSFRTNASSGTAVADVDRVGGEDPVKIDAGNGSTTLAALTTATTTAQSVAPVTVAAANVSGVDFGFNFDTIVSTRAAGQGSLDQFLRNSNALGNAGLAQSGLTAGVEHSLFMIPGGAAVPGLRAGLTNQLTAGRALITLTGLLPAIFGANGAATAVDGTTQTVRVGNTNPVTLGIGGTVGTGADAVAGTADEPALPQVAGPEVQLVDGAGLLVGLDVQASDVTVRGIAIFGFGSAINNGNVRVGLDATTNYTGTLLEDNVIGASAGAFTDPDLTVPGSGTAGSNVAILGADGGTIRRNLVGYAGSVGVTLGLGADGWTIRENEVRRNGLDAARLDGVGLTVSSSAGIVTGNLLIDNQGAGLDFFTSFGGHTVENNTIEQNGWGGVETTGVRMFGQNSTIRHNWIHDNQGSGVLAVVDDVAFPETPAIRKRITRNQFGDNGSNAIDLQTTLDVVAPGDGITTNDGTLLGDSSVPNVCGTVASHGNEGLDTPLLDVVLLAGTTLSVVGRACPNSTVEIYRSVAGAGDTLAATNYGEGVEYLGQATAAPATGVFSFSGPVGFGVGTEVSAIAIDTTNNTSEFSPAVAAAPLEIVKHAFETDGTPIPDGILLPRGTLVEFVLYVNNPGAAALDVTLRDVLDPTFAYVAGSLRFDGTTPACAAATCTPAEEATIFAAADGGAPGTDAVDGDVVGFVAATVEAGNQYVGNAQLNVPAGKVWAVVFTVRMQ